MTLNAAVYGEKFEQLSNDVIELLEFHEFSNVDKNGFENEISNFKQRGFLTVAFIGEYSAGKSSIISALTDRRDLKISADIATDQTGEYLWKGIKVIDTPGLWTERADHDAMTLDAISRADLLVYCLTYSLFDTTTLSYFKKLAFELNFQTKMMLVVNKMSAESGEDEEKIKSYISSLKDSLIPYELERFPIYFCDALDYIEGTDANDAELIELSRFDTLVSGLNDFVDSKGALARLETPIRIALNYVDKVSDIALRNDTEDDAFTQLLTKISRSSSKNRQLLRSTVEGLLLDLERSISEIGRSLAQQIGISESMEFDLRKSEIDIKKLCEETTNAFELAVEKTVKDLQADIGRDLNSSLMNTYINYAETKIDSVDDSQSHISDSIKKNLNTFSNIATKIGAPINQSLSTTLSGSASNYVGGIAKATQVSGSLLHSGVYSAGKLVGYSFKPWQAVNLAKNIGNAVAVVGVVISIASIFMDASSEVEEANNERKISEAKRDLINEYKNTSQSLVKGFQDTLKNIEQELFSQVESMISDARKDQELSKASSNTMVKKIIHIRTIANTLLLDIGN